MIPGLFTRHLAILAIIRPAGASAELKCSTSKISVIKRQLGWCVYCGGAGETRDHVPSKVFLDEPYPTDLPVVASCQGCNSGFSLDEEYLACVTECVLAGSSDPEAVERQKIRRALVRKPALATRIVEGLMQGEDGPVFQVDPSRVRNVILKLARGHSLSSSMNRSSTNPSA